MSGLNGRGENGVEKKKRTHVLQICLAASHFLPQSHRSRCFFEDKTIARKLAPKEKVKVRRMDTWLLKGGEGKTAEQPNADGGMRPEHEVGSRVET